MAETKAPRQGERLPIKLIMPNQGKQKKVPGGGAPPKPFRDVDTAFRKSLSTQVSATRAAVLPQVKEIGAAPVRVQLISRAAAKSHRPEQLFSDKTCPIVGAGRMGELFVKATPDGLDNLNAAIETKGSDRLTKELSCIEAIEPVTPSYRRRGLEPLDVLRRSPRGPVGFVTRVQLFDMGDTDQDRLVQNFKDTCQRRGIAISNQGYSPASFTYSAECATAEDVDALSKVVGVRSVASMPLIRTVRPQALNSKPLPSLPQRSDVDGDVPVVVVVDSGITDRIPALNSWVVGRDSYVAPPYQNNDHGTFVAGLVCWGRDLNPTVAGIDPGPCAVFDLQVIPNADPSKGDTDGLSEQEFLVSLESALKEHANEFKVWNLSLGTDARALITHHARDPRTQQRVPDTEENFFGFGLPAPVPYCLECTPYTSTLVFEDALRPGYYLEWDDFPYPQSLQRNGRFFGDIWMTVAFAPARGARWGSEYCETHIDAHFGVYRDTVSRDTGEVRPKFEGLVPPEHKNPGVLYESYQVAALRKWAPVRTYYGHLGANGKRGSRWRLKVQLLTRHGVEEREAMKSQPFSLIVTIADPEKKAPVYDEMARSVHNRFQSQNLAVRAAARVRGRT